MSRRRLQRRRRRRRWREAEKILYRVRNRKRSLSSALAYRRAVRVRAVRYACCSIFANIRYIVIVVVVVVYCRGACVSAEYYYYYPPVLLPLLLLRLLLLLRRQRLRCSLRRFQLFPNFVVFLRLLSQFFLHLLLTHRPVVPATIRERPSEEASR